MAKKAVAPKAPHEAEIREDLTKLAPDVFASKWIMDRVPHIFDGDAESFRMWKHSLCKQLKVDAACLLVVGSAAVGVSLSPYKKLKAFEDTSDVDLAVISTYYFDIVWRWLRSLGADRYALPPDVQHSIDEHRVRLVYWGIVATDKLLAYTPLGPEWLPALATVTKEGQTAGRDVKIRLYRDFEALRAYQVNAIRELNRKLAEGA
jgi:hypothetical protein